MIKKLKIEKVYITDEKEIVAKNGKSAGKTFVICPVSIKIADDCPDYAGKWIRSTYFSYEDKNDPKKNKTAKERAELFRDNNEGKAILLDVTEREYVDKDGNNAIALEFKTLTKAQKEVAAQFIKE